MKHLLALVLTACASPHALPPTVSSCSGLVSDATPPPPPRALRWSDGAHAMVVTNDERSAAIALSVLKDGGTAADAYVAAAVAETVVFPGVTSLAGFSGMLYFDARTSEATYVVGSHGAPAAVDAAWSPAQDSAGRSAALPGAVFGFAEATRRFGRRSLAADLAPAIALARGGITVNTLYAQTLRGFQSVLATSDYGRTTYLPNGRPLADGAHLALPVYADTLTALGNEGPAYFTHGPWAEAFVRTVNAAGGKVTLADLRDREALVLPALRWNRHGDTVLLGTGPAKGGAASLMIASAIFDTAGASARPASPEWMNGVLLAFVGAMMNTPWTHARDLPDSAALLAAQSQEKAQAALAALTKAFTPKSDTAPHHSSAIVVVDADGNIAAGMHTINALPFGRGLFVGGVPLSSALQFEAVPPGASVLEPVAPLIVLRAGAPLLALAQFGVGEFPADFAVLTSVLDSKLDLVDAVSTPRIGFFDVAADLGSTQFDGLPPIAVDPRIPHADLCALAARGWPLNARADVYDAHLGYVDAVSIAPGRLRGVPAERLGGVAVGY